MADFDGQPEAPWSWVPDEWLTPQAPPAPDLALTEYGLPSTGAGIPGQIPAPPPPPPPVKRFGGQPPIEETAVPVPDATPPASDYADVSTEPKWLTGADDPWDAANTNAASSGLPSFADESAIPQPPGTEPAGEERRTEEEVAAKAAAYAANPEQLLRDETDFAEKQRRFRENRAMEEAEKNRQAIERNFAAEKQARAEAQAESTALRNEAQALADGKFGWASKSTGQKFAGIIAAVVGGLVAGRTGGPNTGLQMIEREIERDLQTRKDALNFKRGLLADKQANAAAELRSAEAQRIALYEHAIRQVETEAGQFDPRGRQAMERAKIAMGLRQGQAQALAAAEDRAFKQAKAAADLRNVLADAKLKEQKLAGVGMGGGGGGGAAAQDKKTFTSEELKKQLPPGAWVPPAGWSGTLRDYSQLADAANKGQTVAAGGAVGAEQRQASQEREIPGVTEFDAKGNKVPFQAKGTVTELSALRNKITGTREIVSLLDEARSIRSGWSSDAGNSDENQKLKTIMGKIEFAVKNAENLGQITENDREMVGGLVGTADFTKYKDFEAAITQARKNLVGSARNALRGQGLSDGGAAKFDIPNLYGAKHTTTAGEANFKERDDLDKSRYGAEQPRSTETGEIQFTGDLPVKPVVPTLESERLKRAKIARRWELEKELGLGNLPKNAQGKVIDPKTGEVLE